MTNRILMKTLAAGLAGACLLLAACGGGGGGGSGGGGDAAPTVQFVPGTDVPASATASAGGAFEFVLGLLATTSETSDPITDGTATLGTSETEDSRALQ